MSSKKMEFQVLEIHTNFEQTSFGLYEPKEGENYIIICDKSGNKIRGDFNYLVWKQLESYNNFDPII